MKSSKKIVSRRPACPCIRCACECVWVWVCVSVHSGVKFYWVEIRNICKLRNNLMARLIGFLACTQRRNEKNENISKKSPARRNERETQPWEKGRPEKDCMARWGRGRGTGHGAGAGTDWKSFVGIWQTNQLKLSATNGANKNLMCG